MFNVQLDENLSALGIESYGIGVTTMEEVFLRVAKEQLEEDSPPPTAQGASLYFCTKSFFLRNASDCCLDAALFIEPLSKLHHPL